MKDFEVFVLKEFKSMDLEFQVLMRYVVVNFVGMSVFGLKRYWVKKQ